MNKILGWIGATAALPLLAVTYKAGKVHRFDAKLRDYSQRAPELAPTLLAAFPPAARTVWFQPNLPPPRYGVNIGFSRYGSLQVPGSQKPLVVETGGQCNFSDDPHDSYIAITVPVNAKGGFITHQDLQAAGFSGDFLARLPDKIPVGGSILPWSNDWDAWFEGGAGSLKVSLCRHLISRS